MNTDKKIKNLEERINSLEKKVNRKNNILNNVLLQRFVKAAEKQKHALSQGGWGHAIWCNFGTENDFCNCGVADLQRALELYEESNEEEDDIDHPLDLLRPPK